MLAMTSGVGALLLVLGAKKSCHSLKLLAALRIFRVAIAAGAPIGLRDWDRRRSGVRCRLVPILLQGGIGFEV
jgi:hypothetical protein